MTTNTRLGPLGIAALLIGGVALWYFTMPKWVSPYQQTNATWRIQGICTNAQDGTPLKGAQVTAIFKEAIALKHHWPKPAPPPARTDVVTKTDGEGRFEVTGVGGWVYTEVQAEGYREREPWENWDSSAWNGISRVDTNIVLSLEPASKSAQEK